MSRVNAKYRHKPVIERHRHVFLKKIEIEALDKFNEYFVARSLSVVYVKFQGIIKDVFNLGTNPLLIISGAFQGAVVR